MKLQKDHKTDVILILCLIGFALVFGCSQPYLLEFVK